MAKTCPKCGLFNPDEAERCDCGWDFASKRVAASYARPDDREIAGERGMNLSQVGARTIKTGAIALAGGMGWLVVLIATNNLRGLLRAGVATLAAAGVLLHGIGQRARARQIDRDSERVK